MRTSLTVRVTSGFHPDDRLIVAVSFVSFGGPPDGLQLDATPHPPSPLVFHVKFVALARWGQAPAIASDRTQSDRID
jgi:hypothetical protein